MPRRRSTAQPPVSERTPVSASQPPQPATRGAQRPPATPGDARPATPAAKAPWFKDGLQFTCTQCGNCCTGEPGFIFLNDQEADALAERLGLDPVAFRRRYTATVHHEHGTTLSLREQGDGACVFWRAGAGCTVYEHRPTQCRTWPFWRRVLTSKGQWKREAAQCPGMDHGALHSAETIQATAAADGLPG